MNSIKKLLFLLLVVVLASWTNRESVRYMPHNWATCELKDGVKSIKEITYTDQKKTGIIHPIRNISFDESGQLFADKRYGANDSTFVYYMYDKNGRLENIVGDLKGLKKFIPEYNDFGDLVKETYVQGDDKKTQYSFEYTYDDQGHITSERLCLAKSQVFPTEYTYNGDQLVKKIVYSSNSETHYKYDNASNCTEKSVYEGKMGEKRKLTAKYTYTYTFDERGNWTERIEKRKGKVTAVTTREIEYHDVAITAPVETQEESDQAETVAPVETQEQVASQAATASSAKSQKKTSDEKATTVANKTKKAEPRKVVKQSYFERLKVRINLANYTTETPAVALTVLVILLTLVIAGVAVYFLTKKYDISQLLTHDTGYEQRGVKKMWMFRWGVYAYAGIILATLIVSFIAAILTLFIIGAVLWLLMWICQILFWVTIIGGAILLGLSLINIFLLHSEGRFGCGSLIAGGVILGCSDWLGDLGEKLVEWGTEAMRTLNLFQWGVNLFTQFWDVILLAFFSPMAIFLAIALLSVLFALLLMGSETLVMRIYSVRRPCPHCGSTVTPKYIINKRNGAEHPVALHPGIYGIFHHKVNDSILVPTMLANGKGKLDRICSECNEKILANAEHTFGTEVHIGIVGNRSSGKSYLLYSGLALLKNLFTEQISQIDADQDTDIDAKYQRIAALAGIQTDTSLHHAVQLIYKSKRRMPFHLFFYDVAGEKFEANKRSSQYDMDFYKHVQSVVFVIDPAMVDVTGVNISVGYAQWLKQNASNEIYDVEGIFGTLYQLIEKYNKDIKNIDFNFVCVKSDMGYFKACGYSDNPTEEEIQTFMDMELGLGNLVRLAKNNFKSIHYYDVSVVENDKSKLQKLFLDLLAQRNVSK